MGFGKILCFAGEEFFCYFSIVFNLPGSCTVSKYDNEKKYAHRSVRRSPL